LDEVAQFISARDRFNPAATKLSLSFAKRILGTISRIRIRFQVSFGPARAENVKKRKQQY